MTDEELGACYDELRRAARMLARDASEADEILQEAVMSALRSPTVDTLTHDERIRWMKRAMKSRLIDIRCRERMSRERDIRPGEETRADDLTYVEVMQALGKPPKCIFILRYIARALAQLYSVYNVLRSAPCKRVQYALATGTRHLFTRFNCICAYMRGQHYVFKRLERFRHLWLMREHIQRRAAYSMCLKRIYKRIGIDNAAARCVDYKRIRLH